MNPSKRLLSCVLGATFLGAPACGGDPPGGPNFGSGGEETAAATETVASAGMTTSDATTAPEGGDHDGTGPKLDVAAGEGGGHPGCTKVDFLFIIDNSGSMFDEQQKLIASFPSFIAAIEDAVDVTDFHIMVIDTDGWESAGETHNCAPEPCCDGVCANNPVAICNDVACPTVSDDVACDQRMGAGLVRDANGVLCPIQGSQRYLTADQPDLDGTFACLATVGIGGFGAEEPMDALRLATDGELGSAGSCNEGFLREDAILVVTLITDEEDRELLSDGDPPDWHDALVAAKGGNPESIVVLGIVGDELDSMCDDGNIAVDAPRLRHFIDLFGPRGFTASICEPELTPFFLDAVGTIDSTCDDFEPEG